MKFTLKKIEVCQFVEFQSCGSMTEKELFANEAHFNLGAIHRFVLLDPKGYIVRCPESRPYPRVRVPCPIPRPWRVIIEAGDANRERLTTTDTGAGSSPFTLDVMTSVGRRVGSVPGDGGTITPHPSKHFGDIVDSDNCRRLVAKSAM